MDTKTWIEKANSNRDALESFLADYGNGTPLSDTLMANPHALYAVLSCAWVNVPDTPACWDIKGFGEAVELLEDPPEDSPEDASCKMDAKESQ